MRAILELVTSFTMFLSTQGTSVPDFLEAPVRWVTVTNPVHTSMERQPLFGDRDQEKIAKIVSWIHQAKNVDGTGMTAPLKGRSFAVNVIYNNGNAVQVRPAWRCHSKRISNGTETSCNAVNNTVWISVGKEKEFFAKSIELFEFLSGTFRDWMPEVNPFEVPERVKVGEQFTIQGNGLLCRKVKVEIRKKEQVVWSSETNVDHGHFEVHTTFSNEVGHYDVWIQQIPYNDLPYGGGGMGRSLELVK